MIKSGFKRKSFEDIKLTPYWGKSFNDKPKTTLKRSGFKKTFELTPKKELDMIVSQVVRLSSASPSGMVKCITCTTVRHWKLMECGHFQRRAHMTTRYDMRNLGPQCVDCNEFNDGMEEEFEKYIEQTHGKGTADLLRKRSREITHDFPFEQEIIKWGAVLKELQESRNNQIQY